VPNCRVPIKFAIFGGIVTAICFELLKAGFGAMVANSSFQLIYGAFAVVPLFLLWVNFLWMIILLGAVFVRTLAEKDYTNASEKHSNIVAILLCLAKFREKAKTGEVASDKDCVGLGLGLVHWQKLRLLLVKNKWIAVTDTGNYVLCRDLKQFSLWDVSKLVQLTLGEPDKRGKEYDPVWLSWVAEAEFEVNGFAKKTLALSLEDLYSTNNG
ncbi:MAG: membrane protein, partial [Lentisphaeria bacterium]